MPGYGNVVRVWLAGLPGQSPVEAEGTTGSSKLPTSSRTRTAVRRDGRPDAVQDNGRYRPEHSVWMAWFLLAACSRKAFPGWRCGPDRRWIALLAVAAVRLQRAGDLVVPGMAEGVWLPAAQPRPIRLGPRPDPGGIRTRLVSCPGGGRVRRSLWRRHGGRPASGPAGWQRRPRPGRRRWRSGRSASPPCRLC